MATFGFNRTALGATQPKLNSMFCALISRRANVVWPPQSCDLTPLDYYLRGAVKDKCYADKPEKIDALKDNIREVIGEIQLQTINNVLKNWTDRVCAWATEAAICMKLFSIINRKDCPFK